MADNEIDDDKPTEMLGVTIGDLLTEKEVCKLLGIGSTKIWQLRRDGKIKFCRVGTRCLYRRQHILDYLDSVTRN